MLKTFMQGSQCLRSSFSRRFSSATWRSITIGLSYLSRFLWLALRYMLSALLYVAATILRLCLALAAAVALVLYLLCGCIAVYLEGRDNGGQS